MKSQPSSFEEVATLEEEVTRAEEKLAAVSASIRAATVEVAAARNSSQFVRDALRPWWLGQSARPGDGSALAGLACGAAAGTGVTIVLMLVLRWMAK